MFFSNKTIKYFLIAFTLIFFLVLLSALFFWRTEIKSAFYQTTLESFFEIRLFEIFQILITILVAIYITYLVNTVINFEVKKRDVFDKLLTNFQENLYETIQLTYDYINKPDKKKEKKIKLTFKNLSILLGIILDIEKCNKNLISMDASLQEDFWRFKEYITDTPFGQKSPKYSVEKITQIQSVYSLLLNKIYKCKLMLYD
jgi:hypothetical protein